MSSYDRFLDAWEDGCESLAHAKDLIRMLRRMVGRTQDKVEDALQSSRRAARQTKQFTHKHPVSSVGMALVTGLAIGSLIGLLTRRRS